MHFLVLCPAFRNKFYLGAHNFIRQYKDVWRKLPDFPSGNGPDKKTADNFQPFILLAIIQIKVR